MIIELIIELRLRLIWQRRRRTLTQFTSLCASTVSTLTVHSFTRSPLDAELESVNRFNYRKANVKFEEVCAKSQARFAWILFFVCLCVCAITSGIDCATAGVPHSAVVHQFYLGKCETMRNDGQVWVDWAASVSASASVSRHVCLGLFIWVMHRSSLKGKHAACAVCHLPLAASRMPHATCHMLKSSPRKFACSFN